MSESLQVELVCDGAPGMGYGHVRRTLALADALRRSGVVARVRGRTPVAQALLPAQPAAEGVAPVVLLDLPGDTDAAIAQARAQGRRVVALDCFGDVEPDLNVVVYPHAEVRARLRSWVGFEYMVVREEIASLPRRMSGEGVVIVLGGGDVLDQGHAAAASLARQGLQVTLVQGPLAANRAPGEGYRVLSDPPDLPALLQGCAWAVTNGGTCMFEALCLGKPAVALPQTPQEAKLAGLALERGALLGVGLQALRPWDAAALQAVAPRAAALVDGRGAQRIVGLVKELL